MPHHYQTLLSDTNFPEEPQFLFFGAVFWAAKWFFETRLSVCNTHYQKIVFWFVAIVTGFVYAKEVLEKIKRDWEFAHTPGAFEAYFWKRKLNLHK